MTEILVRFLKQTQPSECLKDADSQLSNLDNGNFENIFQQSLARNVFDHAAQLFDGTLPEELPLWTTCIERSIEKLQSPHGKADPLISLQIFIIGLASLNAFLQSNITGPPLGFSSAEVLLPQQQDRALLRQQLLESLSVDGESVYKLTPNIELFCLARTIFKNASVRSNVKAAFWASMRTTFLHQRLLSESAASLQSELMDGIQTLKLQTKAYEALVSNLKASALLEIATIELYYGNDKSAQTALSEAINARQFQFALTGLLGKRTKFQQKETSQLVVLAKSDEVQRNGNTEAEEQIDAKPVTVDLNDETVLDSISFSKKSATKYEIQKEDEVAEALKVLDPEKQPQLHPLDSVILLSIASSITNTSPTDGLTREETLPYATRVLEGGSSNWQVYTQALLIRSRIEGYRARTVERGLLQLQALVDQVIADTVQGSESSKSTPATFLRKAKESESAPASQRLLYIHQLASPTRWELEAELAARWISLGGLKSALEIYERLEMWADVALCWAGIDKEDKARQIVRKQLFMSGRGDILKVGDEEVEAWNGPERIPSPADAPRLYCILGDLDKDHTMYERAWEISGHRYFRAQKSLGRLWYARKEYEKAVLAFSKAVQVKQLDHATWFAMGCALLELNQFARASEVFSRAVQLDDQDGESWSNLAVALLNQDDQSKVEQARSGSSKHSTDGKDDVSTTEQLDDSTDGLDENVRIADPQKNRKDALQALKQAAKLKRDNYRIWDNLLTVASTLDPPSYLDMISAQNRIIELRGSIDGEKCVDENIVAMLVQHVTSSKDLQSPETPGMSRMIFQLVDHQIVPLITSSSRLWLLVAQLAEWRGKPEAALNAYEKSWRVVTVQPGWEHGTQTQWENVVIATSRLAEAYKTLGQVEKVEGMGAGSGELVRKDWKFKARSAIRGILGRAKDSWEGTEGWDRLNALLKSL